MTMKKKLNLLAYFIVVLITTSCNANHAAGAGNASNNNLTNGDHLVEVVADSALVIDKGVETGQAKFYLENKSNYLVNDISVHSTSANLVINDASECHKALAPHQTCAVIYTAKLAKDKNKDSANVSAIFMADQKYKSDGQVDMLRNPDIGDAQFVVVNTRARKNDDSELIIHGVGSNDNHKYTVSSVTVNGHKISLANNSLKKNGLQSTINGGENLTVLVPTEIVNDSDPYNSQMTMSLEGTIDGAPTNLMQSFLVADAPAGFVYEPTTGYLNPTHNLNIATVGVVPQPYSISYKASIPAGAVTDDTTHIFTATLQPTTSTASNLQCSQLISFVNNSCQVNVTGSGGTSSAVENSNCIESIVIDPRKWGNTTQYLQCQYIPQIQDSNGQIESLNPSGVLTVNLSNMNNPVSAAMLVDNAGYVAAVNPNAGTMNYGGNPALPFTLNGSTIKSPTYRWVQIYNYESVESIQLYYQVPSNTAGQNANLIESPSYVGTVIGSGATACHSGDILAPGSNCYIIMLVSPSDYAGIAGDMVTLQARYTSLTSGRVSYYSTNLYMQYSGLTQYLGNMSTVVGGPNGTAFNESMPELSFMTEAANGNNGGNSIAECGTSSNNNTYQCIAQGSYLNVKLPILNNFLPGQFTYVLANESALTAQGFKITYALANTATPSVAATTWGVGTGGCKIPAYSPSTMACYINVQNTWNPNNNASGNIALNVLGYFANNPNMKLSNNWINFYAVNPTSKVLSMYNTTSDNTTGSDSYWNSGESFNYINNLSSPESFYSASSSNRFSYLFGDNACILDKITGLLWYFKPQANSSLPISTLFSNPGNIICGGYVVATNSGAGTVFGSVYSRIPSLREFTSIFDLSNSSSKLINLPDSISSNVMSKFFGLVTSTPLSTTATARKLIAVVGTPASATDGYSFDWIDGYYGGSQQMSVYCSIKSNCGTAGVTAAANDWSTGKLSPGASSAASNLQYILVAQLNGGETINGQVFQYKNKLLKGVNTQGAASSYQVFNGDEIYQESSLNIGVNWPTSGNGTVSTGQLVPKQYGSGRYVNDATGNCLIDLVSGIMYPKNPIGVVSSATTSTDFSSIYTSYDKAGGANYGYCGMKNWRIINAREFEYSINYLCMGWDVCLTDPSSVSFDNANGMYGNDISMTWVANQGNGTIYGSIKYNTSYRFYPALNTYTNINTTAGTNKTRYIPFNRTGRTANQYFATNLNPINDTALTDGSVFFNLLVAGGAARIQP